MDSRILHYEFVTGESVNITVSAEIAEVIYDSRRMEHASNERSRYHTAFSLDSEDYEGTNLVSEKTPDDLMEELEDREHLLDCLAHLSENQRQRILMLAQGMSITEIGGFMNENDRTTLEQAIYEEMELTPEMIRSIRTLCGVCLCSFVESKAFKIAIVPSADRSMDTCTVCQTRRGHDYVVMNR